MSGSEEGSRMSEVTEPELEVTIVRKRKQKEEGDEREQEKMIKHEKAFHRAYATWKDTAKASRSRLKESCMEVELSIMKSAMTKQHGEVQAEYEALGSLGAPSSWIVSKMDACGHLTQEINDLIVKEFTPHGDPHVQRERV